MSSKIFVGYRALGFVSNHIPLQIRCIPNKDVTFIVTTVGKCFHTYGTDKFHLLQISNPHPEEITCLAVDSDFVYTSYKNVILATIRGTEVRHCFKGHHADVRLLLPFGAHLLSVDEANILKIWIISTQDIYSEIEFSKNFEITCMMHPHTYSNKILFGSQKGELQLWNVRINKLLYTFTKWKSPITVVEQAPAVDVVAIGFQNGQVILHNLKYDEELMTFTQDWGAITNIAFRTDGEPIMITGSPVGHLALWDLEKRQISGQMRNAHNGSVTGMKCLQSEPLLVTSSPDNTLKMWIFDKVDGCGRLLKVKEGHAAPPNHIRFYGLNGKNILSAGQDSSLRIFSTVSDILNKNLGKASFKKNLKKKFKSNEDPYQMPCITTFDCEKSRESEWDNIAACHRNLSMVTTWSYQRCTMGDYKLAHERFLQEKHLLNAVAMCVTITSCGNFVAIGYSSGHIDVFNIQSGIHRGSFGNPAAHKSGVRGLAIDVLNQLLISGGGDQCLKFWKFKSRQLIEEIYVHSSIDQMILNRESFLLAVHLDNFEIHIFDVHTRKQVRKFCGHTSQITDMTFAMLGRWLISSSMDSTIRTWNLPTGNLVDCFLLDSPCTSLSMSPTNEYLATIHVDDLGIYLWANMTLFTYISLTPLPADFEPCLLPLPGSEINKTTDEEEIEFNEKEFEFKSPEQIEKELVTLSELSRARWHSLFYLEIVKERNKPIEPPKKPKSAPFFLPTIAGFDIKFAPLPNDIQTNQESSKVFKHIKLTDRSEFQELLENYGENHHRLTPLVQKLKQMGPSAIDIEIRGLNSGLEESFKLLILFMNFLMDMLESRTEFELIQALLGLFLKLHGDLISKEEELQELAFQLLSLHKKITEHFQELSHQILGTVTFFKSAAI